MPSNTSIRVCATALILSLCSSNAATATAATAEITASISKPGITLKISFVMVSPYSLATSSNAVITAAFSVKFATASLTARTNSDTN